MRLKEDDEDEMMAETEEDVSTVEESQHSLSLHHAQPTERQSERPAAAASESSNHPLNDTDSPWVYQVFSRAPVTQAHVGVVKSLDSMTRMCKVRHKGVPKP